MKKIASYILCAALSIAFLSAIPASAAPESLFKDEVYLDYQKNYLDSYDLDANALIDARDFAAARSAEAAAVTAGEEYDGVSCVEIAEFLIKAPQHVYELTLEQPYSADYDRDGVIDYVDVRGKLEFRLLDVNKDGKVNAKDRALAEEFIKLFEAAGVECDVPDPEDYVVVGAYGDNAGGAEASLCDVNGDGKVNAKDVTVLMKEIVGTNIPAAAFDVNADGKVNAKDVSALMKYIVK